VLTPLLDAIAQDARLAPPLAWEATAERSGQATEKSRGSPVWIVIWMLAFAFLCGVIVEMFRERAVRPDDLDAPSLLGN
jgi:hypothetical protein